MMNKQQVLDLVKHTTDTYDEQAKMLAFYFHRNQVDKQGVPYFYHVHDVATRFDSVNKEMKDGNWRYITVAYLHDLLEDTEVTYEDLSELFRYAPEILIAVSLLTHFVDEPYEDYIRRLANDDLAKQVKLADIASNRSRLPELQDLETKERLYKKYNMALKLLGEL